MEEQDPTGADGTGLVQISFRIPRDHRRLLKKLAADRYENLTMMLVYAVELVLREAYQKGWTENANPTLDPLD